MRKRCTLGKSCGATCISRRKICLLDLGKVIMEYKGGKVIKEDPRAAAAYRRAYGP